MGRMPLRMGQRGVGSGRANWEFSWRARLAKSLGLQMLGETKLSQLIDTKAARFRSWARDRVTEENARS